MNPFDIFITFISWESGGKSRPVLVLQINGNTVSVYPITTQYEKSACHHPVCLNTKSV